ncbi:MAG: serine/threonine protein kinase, partial [Deltaproteobacteria bacterium]|nr:serine/threonine protein kinase [Deltaproteobacteria bacterium]
MEDSSAKDMESVRPSRGQRPPPDSEAPARAVPEKIGRYQLCFELASGGMASVYLARAGGVPGFEKLVALKRIHPHLADEKDYIEMFLDEARIASRITHPNVCSVFDFGEADGEYFIAMEYLVGEPLSRVHRRVVANADQRSSALLPARMAAVIAQACEGLHAAHELQDAEGESLHVVHRDVSTENLFVTYSGATQVVDFGIAHARQRVHHTEAGQVKGTFPYMAPEQMTAAVVDRRVDVWALGAVLWELLTLQRLFLRDTDVNTMYAVLSGEIRPPSDHRSDVPAELDEIVLKALQRSPDERWQSARQMGKALRRFLANQEELVGPAEIADWMAELFPNGESRKRQLMEIARTTNASVESDPPRRAQDKSGRRGVQIPPTSGRRMPAAPPLPASLLVMVIGVATV